MRALLDGVFEAEEGFQEVENDDEFEDKGGKLLRWTTESISLVESCGEIPQMVMVMCMTRISRARMMKQTLNWLVKLNSKQNTAWHERYHYNYI